MNKTLKCFVGIGWIATLACGSISWAADSVSLQKGTAVTVSARFEVKATPDKVWSALCSAEGFTALSGFKVGEADKAKSFARLGDSIPAQIWDDKGRLVVTQIATGKELRVTWEPEGGHYLCAKRILLKATGSGTLVEYWDRYTDDQPNADETAKQVVKETESAIQSFRARVEK